MKGLSYSFLRAICALVIGLVLVMFPDQAGDYFVIGRAPQASQARPAPRMAGSLSDGGLWPPQKASSRSGEAF